MVLTFVLVTCAALATLAAQQKPTFRSGIEVVAVDVNRWQMIEYVDVGPFVDIGTVGAGLSKLSGRHISATSGLRAGLRYRSRVLFHFDWGQSREGQTITAGTGVVF